MLEDHVMKTCGPESAAQICAEEAVEPVRPTDPIGFAPEMQEGDAADAILSMRQASWEALQATGQTLTPSMATTFGLHPWPVGTVQ